MSNQQPSESLLSPRSLFKLLSSSFQQFTQAKQPQSQPLRPSTDEFSTYLSSLSEELARRQFYKHAKGRQTLLHMKETHLITAHTLQMEFNGRIPSEFFRENMEFELCKRSDIVKRQEQLTEHLDDIEVCIFEKLGKYPGKSFNVISNTHQGYEQVNIILKEVALLRRRLKQEAFQLVRKKQKVQILHNKSKRLQQTLRHLKFIKKVKTLKDLPHQTIDKVNTQHYQFMQSIKPADLNKANSISSLTRIASKLEQYRQAIKSRISQQFQDELNVILKKLLSYNKEQWLKNQVPNNAFTVEIDDDANLNCSVLNISVLDQSLFEIQPQNSLDSAQVSQLAKFSEVIDIYSIWEDIQVNQVVTRNLLKTNVIFNRDLDEYISYILNHKGIKVNKSRNKMQYIEMRFYYKLVKVYFDLLKSLLTFIRQHRQLLPFLQSTIPKIYQFIISRMQHFLKLKPIHQKTTKDDLYHYLSMIDYWIFQDELYQQLKLIKNNVVEQHLVSLHTTILVSELRTAIQKSNFVPINIPSEYFVTLELILSWSRNPQDLKNNQALQMSMSICGGGALTNFTPSHTFKVIDKILIVQGKSYKVCDTFLLLLKYLQHYLQLHAMLQELRLNIEEKIFQVIGSFVWFNKKFLIPQENGKNNSQQKSVRNICLFLSMVELIGYLVNGFELNNAKKKKLVEDIERCSQSIKKQISMMPYLLLQEQIQILFQSRISQRHTIPTAQTVKITQILSSGIGVLKEYFNDRKCISLLTPSVKMIYKNYFGYLVNREKRGKEELKWFLPKFKELLNEWFPEDVSNMQKELKNRR